MKDSMRHPLAVSVLVLTLGCGPAPAPDAAEKLDKLLGELESQYAAGKSGTDDQFTAVRKLCDEIKLELSSTRGGTARQRIDRMQQVEAAVDEARAAPMPNSDKSRRAWARARSLFAEAIAD